MGTRRGTFFNLLSNQIKLAGSLIRPSSTRFYSQLQRSIGTGIRPTSSIVSIVDRLACHRVSPTPTAHGTRPPAIQQQQCMRSSHPFAMCYVQLCTSRPVCCSAGQWPAQAQRTQAARYILAWRGGMHRRPGAHKAPAQSHPRGKRRKCTDRPVPGGRRL